MFCSGPCKPSHATGKSYTGPSVREISHRVVPEMETNLGNQTD